jgi:hypothetical protein
MGTPDLLTRQLLLQPINQAAKLGEESGFTVRVYCDGLPFSAWVQPIQKVGSHS